MDGFIISFITRFFHNLNMTSEAGYITIVVDELVLEFNNSNIPKKIRIHSEFLGGQNIVWASSNSTIAVTPELSGFVEQNSENNSHKCTIGCNIVDRSKFVDMNIANVCNILNSYIYVKVLGPDLEPENAGAAKTKNKEATPAPPRESIICEFYFHIASLIRNVTGVLEYGTSFSALSDQKIRTTFSPEILPDNSTINCRLSLDNGFAEFVTGNNVFQWEAACITALPRAWGLPVVETQEKGKAPAKGKTGPSNQERREKYISDLKNTLEGQALQAKYELLIDTSAVFGDIDVLPPISLASGKLVFDFEAAANIDVDEDLALYSEPGLWSVQWGPSQCQLIHRKQISELLGKLKSDTNLSVVARASKIPLAINASDPQSVQINSFAKFDISRMMTNDEKSFVFQLSFVDESVDGSDADASSSVKFSGDISCAFDKPLVVSSTPPPSNLLPVSVISMSHVGGASNRDVKKELQQEITDIIKEIAQEYVLLYPVGPNPSGASTSSAPKSAPFEDRKSHFMYHLSTHGKYHSLKERLKPKIQRFAREKYCSRNRALGKSGDIIPPSGFTNEKDVPIDEMLADLYVHLVKDCNLVLNSLYKDTIIKIDVEEMNRASVIDDETETPQQKFKRLYDVAGDAEADGRYANAEQLHLERIQLLGLELSLETDVTAPHHAYFYFHEYLLRRNCASKLQQILKPDAVTESKSSSDQARARQILDKAIQMNENDWRSLMQSGCLLLEDGQVQRGGELVRASIQVQLNKEILKLDEFQGYESDKLTPVNPMCYVMLSIYFNMAKLPLQSRKAIRLATKSFKEGNYEPLEIYHGKPRRTAVLTLAQSAQYLFERGLSRIGNICLQFAFDCEEAVTQKAIERNIPSDTVPTIRHLLKRAKSMSLLFEGNVKGAIEVAKESVSVADNTVDIVNGLLQVGKCASFIGLPDVSAEEEILSAHTEALRTIQNNQSSSSDYTFIPLSAYLQTGKLLILRNRFTEALDVMLLGCSVYPSSSLFHQVGVCCIRLNRLVDAEDALQEANLLDNRNPEVWAFLSILCLEGGNGRRTEEAQKSLDQSIRLGLKNPSVLRELTTCYIAVDQLQIAEDLVRRALACEEGVNGNGKSGSSHTRRMLGDILAGQNNAAKAIEEYQLVINDETTDVETKLATAEKCLELLNTLGRTEEAQVLCNIMDTLMEGM